MEPGSVDKLTDKLFTDKFNEDTGRPHIEVVDQNVCAHAAGQIKG